MNARLICRHLFASFLAIVTSIAGAPCIADEVANPATPQRLLAGIGARGFFDPSVTEDPATHLLWMSYSSFEASSHSRSGVDLRIAYSDDGDRWHDAGTAQGFTEVFAGPFQATEAGEVAIASESRGTWQNEASTLLKRADSPENLVHAPPIKLFTGCTARTAGESSAAPAFSPIPGPPAIRLDKKDPQLNRS